MTDTILSVLMTRDKMSKQAALDMIDDAKEALQDYLEQDDIESAEDICAEYFGLEPDYIFELL